MKVLLPAFLLFMLFAKCTTTGNVEDLRAEVLRTEKDFEKMVSEKGLAEAFWFFAADDAVIMRGSDSLIKGKENIRNYYSASTGKNFKLSWTPDHIDVSGCGTMAYTYGRYLMITDSARSEGIFHTVWKKQSDKSWKYVWD